MASVPGALISLEEPYEPTPATAPVPHKPGEPMSDEDLLVALSGERRQSAGFEEDAILLGQRERALNYYKGEMPDLPYLPNRSSAVSTDVADAIEAALPDLMEIFTGGDDVLAFQPNGPEDEAQAEQESDYVKKVLFEDNRGFSILHDMFKDALQVKVGVAVAWWEDRAPEVEDFTGKLDVEVIQAKLTSEIEDLRPDPVEPGEPQTYSFTAVNKLPGRCKVASIPPEDFTVARDCVELSETTYCAWRSRPRAQDLLAEGIDRDLVDRLPPYGTTYDDTLKLARDTAGEWADMRSVTGYHDLRQVEVITHVIKIDADGTGPRYWVVRTGNAETVLIDKTPARRVNMAALTPYRIPHRFYGESIADKLLELQRQRTALKRIMLDSAYFALNQRMEVAENKASEWTISDLLDNRPMAPIRSKTGDAVRPIQAGALAFDVLGALEYSAVEAEQRSGISRNANGLSPDTLHQTAHGMLALLQASQKRLRLIAQQFAETGLRDLYLIIHAILREHADQEEVAQLRGKWVPINPTTWAERNALRISVGQGSAGQQAEVQILEGIAALQEKIVQAQLAVPGAPPVVTPQNVYNLAQRIAEKSGEKAPDLYFTNPANAQQQPAGPPPPHPEMIKAQAQAQQAEADRQQQGQIEGAKLAHQQQASQTQALLAYQQAQQAAQDSAARLQLDRERMERDDAFRRDQLAAEMQYRAADLAERMRLEREKLAGNFGQAVAVQHMKDQNDAAQRQADLEIQASEQRDAAKLADKSE